MRDDHLIEAVHAALDAIRNAHDPACQCAWCIISRRRPRDRPSQTRAMGDPCVRCGHLRGLHDDHEDLDEGDKVGCKVAGCTCTGMRE